MVRAGLPVPYKSAMRQRTEKGIVPPILVNAFVTKHNQSARRVSGKVILKLPKPGIVP
jgi:hypothetical protein